MEKCIHLTKSRKSFSRLIGMSPEAFAKLHKAMEKPWQAHLKKHKKQGRPRKLPLSDLIFMTLLYYRTYLPQVFIGELFGLNDSNVCRNIQEVEPLLAKVVSIKKRVLTAEEARALIIDATESPIERPIHGQKAYYSGKKKHHTVKTEIRVTEKGKIVHVSKTIPGATHDFALFKQGKPLPEDIPVLADSGYQGIKKFHKKSFIPFKKDKNTPREVAKEERRYHRRLSRLRVKVENVIREVKTFRIIGEKYRNRRKRYNLKALDQHLFPCVINFSDQRYQIFPSMVKSELTLFRKVDKILPGTTIKFGKAPFGKTPKSFDAVHMTFSTGKFIS